MKIYWFILTIFLPFTFLNSSAQVQFNGIEKQINILHSNSGILELSKGQYAVVGKVSFQYIKDSFITAVDCDSLVFNEEQMILTAFRVYDVRIKDSIHLEPILSPVTIYISKKYPGNSHISWRAR